MSEPRTHAEGEVWKWQETVHALLFRKLTAFRTSDPDHEERAVAWPTTYLPSPEIGAPDGSAPLPVINIPDDADRLAMALVPNMIRALRAAHERLRTEALGGFPDLSSIRMQVRYVLDLLDGKAVAP